MRNFNRNNIKLLNNNNMEPDGGNFSSRESTMEFAHSPEFSESQSATATCSSNNFSRVPQIITRARRRDNCSHDCNSHHHPHHHRSITMLSSSSFYHLVFLTSLLLLCLVPLPVHSLPLEGSMLSSGGESSSSSHRSHLDLLIDPIHQAEFGEDELESKNWVARSVFDMVLRTPPPPTSSATRCPPGTQSPFEGGPCIKKSTDPVAFVDQTFLLDTLRGLAKEGTLLSGGSRTKRPGSGGGGRRRPSISGRPGTRTSTTTSTLAPPTSPMPSTTETVAVAQTTFINPGDISDSEVVTQVPSLVPGKNPPRSRNPEEQTTYPTTQLTSPIPEEDSSNYDNSVTTTMTTIRNDPAPPAQELKRQDENRNDEQVITIATTAATIIPTVSSTPALSQTEQVEVKSGQVQKMQDDDNTESSKVPSSPHEEIQQAQDPSIPIMQSQSQKNVNPNGLEQVVISSPVEPATSTPAETTMMMTTMTTPATTTPVTFTFEEQVSAETGDGNSNLRQPSSPAMMTTTTLTHQDTADPVGAVIGLTGVTERISPSQSFSEGDNNDEDRPLVISQQPSQEQRGDINAELEQGDDSLPLKTRMRKVNVEQLKAQVEDLVQVQSEENNNNVNLKQIESDKDRLEFITPSSLPLSSDDEQGTTEVDEELLFLDTMTTPSSSSSLSSGSNAEQEPIKSPSSPDESNGERRVLLQEQPGIETVLLPLLQLTEEKKQMMTGTDVNMTASKSSGSEDGEGVVEEDRVISEVVIDEEGSGHPSSTVVNHLPVADVLAGAEMEGNDDTVIIGEEKKKDASETTADDLLIINNPKVSPVHREDQGETEKQQVSFTGEGKMIITPLNQVAAAVEEAEMSSSSREEEKNSQGLSGDEPVLNEVELKLQSSPDLATTLVPPAAPSILSTYSPQPQNTLLQFQLPIVTRGPSRTGGEGRNFQRFQEFPQSDSNGRIRFPNELPPVEQNGQLRVPANYRGTFRPVFVQDFQIDYPPRQQQKNVERTFTEPIQSQPKWETPKPFFVPVDAAAPTTTQSSLIEYDTGSTEYLESELDRRHQKSRSRNRIRASDSTTNPPLPPEFSFYPNQHHHPIPAEVQPQQQQQASTTPQHQQQQQHLYFARRNPASDLRSFEYLNYNPNRDRFNNNSRRLIW